jgi:hypothetical protein
MRLLYGPSGPERPFEQPPAGERAFSGDYWGACSLETFADVGGLVYTHEDAGGWLAYLQQFQQENFWFKDGNVKVWKYEETYDNWQDTYGLDAVLAFYHSGHGNMAGDGTFEAPLGGSWDGRTWAFSRDMRLGNEQANYVFWSTCLSLRVLDGHNPIRTWQPANLGFRMLFGFETVSWDDPNYGKNFWNHWKGGESLSTAWLNASWDIAHDQAPSVVAVGADATEAQDRLFNERNLTWSHASTAWWWWRWYNAATAPGELRVLNLDLPSNLVVAELRPHEAGEEQIRGVLRQFGIDAEPPDEVKATQDGILAFPVGEARVTFGPAGAYEVRLARPNRGNRTQMATEQAIDEATRAIERYGLNEEVELAPDRVRVEAEAGASVDSPDSIEGPFVTQTTVQFRQLINGLPVVTPNAGLTQVSLDNDGTVTAVRVLTRPVERLVDRPKNTVTEPPAEPAAANEAQPQPAPVSIERALADAWSRQLGAWTVDGRGAPVTVNIVPGSTEVGYDLRGNEAVLVVQRSVELDLGQGMRKRYRLVAPLVQ